MPCFTFKLYRLPTNKKRGVVRCVKGLDTPKTVASVFMGKHLIFKEKHGRSCRFAAMGHAFLSSFTVYRQKTTRSRKVCQKVLTHQKPSHRFCTLFFEVLPFTTHASSVNGKKSKKSIQSRCDGFWYVNALRPRHT